MFEVPLLVLENRKLLFIFTASSISDVWQGSEYASASLPKIWFTLKEMISFKSSVYSEGGLVLKQLKIFHKKLFR